MTNNTTPLIFLPAERLFKHNFTVISHSSRFFFFNIEFLLIFAFLSILYCLSPTSDTFLCEKKKRSACWVENFFHAVWKMIIYVALKGQTMREF